MSEKLSVDLKLQILTALDYVGGVEWLVKLANHNPNTFAMLLARILPLVEGANATGVQIVVQNAPAPELAQAVQGVLNSPVLARPAADVVDAAVVEN